MSVTRSPMVDSLQMTATRTDLKSGPIRVTTTSLRSRTFRSHSDCIATSHMHVKRLILSDVLVRSRIR